MVANQKTPVSWKSKFHFAFWSEYNIVLKKDIWSSMLKMWMSFLNILIFNTVHVCQMWADLARFLFHRLCSTEARGAAEPSLADLNSACWICCTWEESWETLKDGAWWSCSVLLGWRTENCRRFIWRLGSPLERRARPGSVYSLHTFCWIVYSIHGAGLKV